MGGPFAVGKWVSLFQNYNLFVTGFLNTILISLISGVLALALGIVFGIMSSSQNKALHGISRVYVEIFQNTPLIIQIFFLYNALPYAGVVLPVFAIGVLGIGVYHGAFIAEVVRTGIISTPVSQFEAGYSQGFKHVQTMRYIIIPQAIRVILPPLTNQFVNLIKNTSVLAMIAGGELMYVANSWAGYTLNYGPAYVVAGALYFIFCFPLARFAQKLENKSDKARNTKKVPAAQKEETAVC